MSISTASPAPAGSSAPDGLRERLGRLCDLLGIAGARIVSVAADGVVPLATAGSPFDDLAVFEARAVAAGRPCFIGDAGPEGRLRFYAGLLMPAEANRPPLLVSLFDTAPRSQALAQRLAGLAGEVIAQTIIERQRRLINAQARAISASVLAEDHRRRLFERASATARIGVWQCDLADESLQWTDGVYDLFELPRGSLVTREMTLALYTEASRKQLDVIRSRAIATCTDFTMDAEIVTAKGNRRWMRLTGTVDSQNGVATRIFGMKQDITEEKLMADRTRYLAEFDVMTGLANRSRFQSRLAELDNGQGPAIGALLLVDLDGFKQINDTHGHAQGDECLRETANRLRNCCTGAELVARIGGDEFAVLAPAGRSQADVQAMATDIVTTMHHPFACSSGLLQLGASVGIALNAGLPAAELFRQADTALYAAKAAGRNTSRTFPATTAERRSA